jgi:hypothetical protein
MRSGNRRKGFTGEIERRTGVADLSQWGQVSEANPGSGGGGACGLAGGEPLSYPGFSQGTLENAAQFGSLAGRRSRLPPTINPEPISAASRVSTPWLGDTKKAAYLDQFVVLVIQNSRPTIRGALSSVEGHFPKWSVLLTIRTSYRGYSIFDHLAIESHTGPLELLSGLSLIPTGVKQGG